MRMLRGFSKYKLVYGHLWNAYGKSWPVRVSFLLQALINICKLIFLPIALSLLITDLSRKNYAGAEHAVAFYVGAYLLAGISIPMVKYIGMIGENKSYSTITGIYFSKLITADLDYFHSSLAGYVTTATRQYVDSCMQLVRALRDRYMGNVLSILFPLCVIMWLDTPLGLVALALSAHKPHTCSGHRTL